MQGKLFIYVFANACAHAHWRKRDEKFAGKSGIEEDKGREFTM